jgi:hypothetical protein
MAIGYRHELGSANIVFNGDDAIIAVVNPAVGVLIAVRRRGNRIGWLMIVIGLSLAVCSVAQAYSERRCGAGGYRPAGHRGPDRRARRRP